MTLPRLLAGLICCAALTCAAACAVKQPPPAADALGGVLPPTTAVPAAWKTAAGAPGSVVTEWVSTFSDPQLDVLVEEGLRRVINERSQGTRYRLRKAHFNGNGLQAHLSEASWEHLRELGYEGRSG